MSGIIKRISQKNGIKLTKIGIIQSSNKKSSIVNGKNQVISLKNKGYFHKF
jgi:thiamine-monophosphate kinase